MTPELLPILKPVSRSFYLSIRFLPDDLRAPIAIAYLLARSLDTLADSAQGPTEERLRLIESFLAFLNPGNPAPPKGAWDVDNLKLTARDEIVLIKNFALILKEFFLLNDLERQSIVAVLRDLSQAMTQDLRLFNESSLKALRTFSDTERYTDFAAGSVGRFWTNLLAQKKYFKAEIELETARALGTDYGCALQWINILRDLPKDLRAGRCYLPGEDLAGVGLNPRDLLDPKAYSALEGVYQDYLGFAERKLQKAYDYLKLIPQKHFALRLSTVLPAEIGLATIAALRKPKINPLDPRYRVKISRVAVYRSLLYSCRHLLLT